MSVDTTDKTRNWRITKLQLTPPTITGEFTYDGSQKTASVSFYDSDYVNVSGDTQATEVGNYTITFSLTDTINTEWSDGTTADKTGTWKIKEAEITAHIYGAAWSGGSDPSWVRTDLAANFADPVPYVAGATEYGSPFDDIMPWAGMVVSERTSGTMVAIPKFWYKLSSYGLNGLKIQIADKEVDGFSVSPAHMDRGDGKGERDVIYISRYLCSKTDFKSTSETIPYRSNKNGAYDKTPVYSATQIHSIGSNIWIMDFTTLFTIWLLYLVEFAHWDSQAKIGYGGRNNTTDGTLENNYKTGYTDTMPYHTGTMKEERTAYGRGIQYRNIEGLWDNALLWITGAYYNSNGMYINLNPSNFTNITGGILLGKPTAAGSFPSSFNISNTLGCPIFYPKTASNDADGTIYTCDQWYYIASRPYLT